jgi:2-oxoisovalerate ferredoxin oxidoreductase beta subunit
METGALGLPEEAYRHALEQGFAKKPKLIPLNLEILKAGAEAARVLLMVAR